MSTYVSSYSYICVRIGAFSQIHPLLAAGADINVRPSCLTETGQDGDSEDEDERWNVCVEGQNFATYIEPPPPLLRACESLSRRNLLDSKAKQLGDDFYIRLHLEEQETPQILRQEELESSEEESQGSGKVESHKGSASDKDEKIAIPSSPSEEKEEVVVGPSSRGLM